MKKIFIFGALITGLGAAQAWATPSVTPCPTTETELTTYLAAGFTCQVGDKVFSNFTYNYSSSGGALALGPSSVEVETLGSLTGPDPAQISNTTIGLQFNAGWTALAGQESDSAIGFTVTIVDGANMLIEDTGLAQTSGVIGTSSLASVTEKGCTPVAPATTCTPNAISVMTFDDGTSGSKIVNDVTFSPSGSITVSKDINVTDSGTSGHAEISLVSDTFSQTAVPEPATMLLVGGVLCGIAAIRRRSVRS
jgi:hypothetical protein